MKNAHFLKMETIKKIIIRNECLIEICSQHNVKMKTKIRHIIHLLKCKSLKAKKSYIHYTTCISITLHGMSHKSETMHRHILRIERRFEFCCGGFCACACICVCSLFIRLNVVSSLCLPLAILFVSQIVIG